MDESLEKKIGEAIADPKNMGELADLIAWALWEIPTAVRCCACG